MGLVIAAILLIGGYGMAYYGASNVRNGGQGPGFFEAFGVTSPISTPGGSSSQPNAPGYPSDPNQGNGPGGFLGGIINGMGPIDYSGNPNVGNAPGYNASPGQVTEVV